MNETTEESPQIRESVIPSLGIEKTVKWYLDNEEWLDNVTSGEYEKYYDNMYKNR